MHRHRLVCPLMIYQSQLDLDGRRGRKSDRLCGFWSAAPLLLLTCLHTREKSHFVAGFVKSYGDGDGNEAENLTDFDQQSHYCYLLAQRESCNFVAGLWKVICKEIISVVHTRKALRQMITIGRHRGGGLHSSIKARAIWRGFKLYTICQVSLWVWNKECVQWSDGLVAQLLQGQWNWGVDIAWSRIWQEEVR